MLQKKICMVGAFAVGKTSLVKRFVEGVFADTYLTTVGVKIDQKMVEVDNRPVRLILWDLAGEDQFQKIQPVYLTGSSGIIIVIDATRQSTLSTAIQIYHDINNQLNNIPTVFVVNKTDLKHLYALNEKELQALKTLRCPIIYTSAMTGEGVDSVFEILAKKIVTNNQLLKNVRK
jgi:hypothetical protein